MRKLFANACLGIKRLNPLQYFLIFLFLFAGSVRAAKEDGIHSYNGKPLPSPLVLMDPEGESYAILVEKRAQRLFLYGFVEGDIKLIKSFPCSTGENSGDKKNWGDRRTPEGIYFLNRVFEDEELEQRYGVKAFILDYPNFFDRSQKKRGRGIWLHGTNKALMPNDSKGCIALSNQDLLELSDYISLYRTPVIVLEKIELLPEEVIAEKKRRFETFIMKWYRSWQDKDLPSYMSCYAKDFSSKGMNWEGWKRYKHRLNKKYNEINVTISQVQGFQHHYDLVTFRQDYRSEKFKSKGIKKLYLREDGEELKIVREEWSPLRGGYLVSQKKTAARTTALKKQDNIKVEDKRIRAFVERWRTCWENKRLEEYIQCYSDDFRSRGMNKRGWKKFKRFLNRKYKNIKVMATNAEIDIKGGCKEAEVSFLQRYQSDRYSDEGVKTLLLKKEEGKWHILSETWKPL